MTESERPIEFSMAVLCYGADEEIVAWVEGLHHIFCQFAFRWEIVLVANQWAGQDPRAAEIAHELAARLPDVRVVAVPKEGGMGFDARSGLDACRGRYIGLIDGDGQCPMEAVFSCYAKIKSEDLDVVKTFRVSRRDGIWRGIVSKLFNRFFRLLFPGYLAMDGSPLQDVNAKPKILRREIYEQMKLSSDDWFLDAEMMIQAMQLGCRVYEVPIVFESLEERKSFVGLPTLWEFVSNLLRARFGKNSGPS